MNITHLIHTNSKDLEWLDVISQQHWKGKTERYVFSVTSCLLSSNFVGQWSICFSFPLHYYCCINEKIEHHPLSSKLFECELIEHVLVLIL